jgi:hypothetical protein
MIGKTIAAACLTSEYDANPSVPVFWARRR